jgi:enterochelin esterase-like enzyme
MERRRDREGNARAPPRTYRPAAPVVYVHARGHRARPTPPTPASMRQIATRLIATALGTLALGAPADAGAQPAPRQVRVQDTLKSPVVTDDGRVTFQLYAPRATEVTLRSEGPAPFGNQKLAKSEAGVWSLSLPVASDLYIYWFDVDGVPVVDPKNNRPRINNSTVRSLLEVPGPSAAFFAERDVPHGAVSMVHYQSKSLGLPRRMHVYTPPGYGTSAAAGTRYPVFYLLHGAGDDDRSWLLAGKANFILDNLIAEGKAKPMIVVMPAGHTPRPGGLFGPAGAADPFVGDFLQDVMPYVERNYRTLPGRTNRAIAGLSMGGNHTLQIGLPNLDKFAWVGVFSSGFLGGQNPGETFVKNHPAVLPDAKINEKLKLFWLATGKEDFILPQTKATLALLDQHKVRYTYKETEGGHTWPNWRAYLQEFTPMLFR